MVTRSIELPSGVVLPGFWDCHVHLASLGAAVRSGWLPEVSSVEELVGRLRDHAAANPQRSVLIVRTPNLEARSLAEGRLPAAVDLDQAEEKRPLIVSDVNKAVGNTAAVERAGLAGKPEPPGGVIERDDSGRPIGVAWFAAKRLLEGLAPAPPPSAFGENLLAGLRFLAQRGVTVAVEAMASVGEVDAIRQLDREGKLPCRVIVQVAASSERQLAKLEGSSLEFGQPLGPMSRLGPAKVFFDGFVTHRTARLRSPYAGEPHNRGAYLNRPEQLATLVRRAFQRGFPVAVHVTGDAATLEAIEVVARERDRRGSRAPQGSYLVHAYFAPPGFSERMAGLALGLVAQPAFLYHWAETLERFIGHERTAGFYPLRRLLAEGVKVAAGSDGPVADPDPFLGLYAATARRSASGRTWGEEHRLPISAAVRLYRENAGELFAWSGFPVEVRPGGEADLVVMDRDPLEASPDELRRIRVLATLVAGRRVV